MDNFTKIKVRCKTNQDLNGEYCKAGIEKEMSEVGIPLSKICSNDWVEYVIMHLSLDEVPNTIYDAICDNDVHSITFNSGDGVVTIEKS